MLKEQNRSSISQNEKYPKYLKLQDFHLGAEYVVIELDVACTAIVKDCQDLREQPRQQKGLLVKREDVPTDKKKQCPVGSIINERSSLH